MGTLTKKKYRLRARARRRRFSLKVNPQTKNVQNTWAMQNVEVLRTLDSKVKAAQAEAQANA